MPTTLLEREPLTAADRCDRCGARAHTRVVLRHGEILLCAHHFREHEDRLRAQAVRIDEAQTD